MIANYFFKYIKNKLQLFWHIITLIIKYFKTLTAAIYLIKQHNKNICLFFKFINKVVLILYLKVKIDF